MGSINIDASLLANHNVTQKEEKVVQMENGGHAVDFSLAPPAARRTDESPTQKAASVARSEAIYLRKSPTSQRRRNLSAFPASQLTHTHAYTGPPLTLPSLSYLIIESTGISEPMQVAETFSAEFSDQMAAEEIEASLPADTDDAKKKRLAQMLADGGLSQISRLDTCVTVVDCTTVSNVLGGSGTMPDRDSYSPKFLGDFDTVDFLSDRHGDSVTPEDERNITDLSVFFRLILWIAAMVTDRHLLLQSH